MLSVAMSHRIYLPNALMIPYDTVVKLPGVELVKYNMPWCELGPVERTTLDSIAVRFAAKN